MIKAIHHIQIAVSRDKEAETISFYKNILGLKEIPKPDILKKNGGAWFEVGLQQFHIAPEDNPIDYNSMSKRHMCFLSENLEETRLILVKNGVEIIPDKQEIAGWNRIYLRDPAGNRVEIAEFRYDT